MFSHLDIIREQESLENTIKADKSLTLFKQFGFLGQRYFFAMVEYAKIKKQLGGKLVLMKAVPENVREKQVERRNFLSRFVAETDFHNQIDPSLIELANLHREIDNGPQTEERIKPLSIDVLRTGMYLAIPIIVCPAYVYDLISFSEIVQGDGKELLSHYWRVHKEVLMKGDFPLSRWMSDGIIEYGR
jgi:hypothetical protein